MVEVVVVPEAVQTRVRLHQLVVDLVQQGQAQQSKSQGKY